MTAAHDSGEGRHLRLPRGVDERAAGADPHGVNICRASRITITNSGLRAS
jgi:hypothetical protein